MRLKKILLTLVIFITTSTSLFANDNTEKLETGRTLLNVIHSDEIRSIMRQLNSLAYEREYTDLELKKISKRQIKLLVKEAAALGDMAANMPKIASLKNLDDENQLAFNAMVRQLISLTSELEQAAEANHQDEMNSAYIKLQNTCNTCHALFRE
jgi:cytochrome c556